MKKFGWVVLFLFLATFPLYKISLADEGTSSSDSGSSGKSGSRGTGINASDINSSIFGKGLRSNVSPLKTLEDYQQAQPSALPSTSRNLSAVNPNLYILQPGDTLSVEIWNPERLQVGGVISPMGTIEIPPIGGVRVQGVALSKSAPFIKAELKKFYNHIQVHVNLTDVRTEKIQILGEVNRPGAYEIPGITGALDAIEKVGGGLSDNGTLRQIEVRTGNKVIKKLDYFKWRTLGDETQNPYLEPNQVIYVSVSTNRVTLEGEVRRPGAYEILPGETYAELLNMAGGYTPESVQSEIKVSRISNREELNLIASPTLVLQDGDAIHVPSMSLFQKRIKVMGELTGLNTVAQSSLKLTPEQQAHIGWYHLHQGDRVRDVILNMGGLTPRADPVRARVERKNARGETEIIPVNLKKLFADNDLLQNIELKDGDTLVIPAAPDSIYVLGEVNKPGMFPYNPGNQIREYLALAGGPSSHAKLKSVKLVRLTDDSSHPEVFNLNAKHLFGDGRQEKELMLQPGDVIYVPRSDIVGFGDVVNLLSNVAILRALGL